MKRLLAQITPLAFLMFIIASCGNQKKYSADVTEGEILAHISYLASDSLEGRKSGTDGNRIAASYIRDRFNDYGLELMGNEGFQTFDIETSVALGEQNNLTINEVDLNPEEDYIPLSISSNDTYSGNLIFAGYGFTIENDSIDWNDYAGLDVKDKAVLLLMGDPEPEKDESAFLPESDLYSKVINARDHGAAAVIFVAGARFKAEDVLEELAVNNKKTSAGIPVVQVSRSACNRIFQMVNNPNTLEDIEEGIINTHRPHSFDLAVQLQLSVDIQVEKNKTSNVIARVEGSDPKLKDEYIVIGAHFDHLGLGGKHSGSRVPDTIAVHNGADDNASGTAGLIELAGYFQAHRSELKRSLLFIAFTGEEMGLIGSKYFVDNPLVDLSQVAAMINFDMIGRLKPDSSIMVGGTGTTPFADSLLQIANKGIGLHMNYSKAGFGASDHSSFYGKKIPVFFITSGSHLHYHTPQDDVEYINAPGEKTIIDFTIQLVKAIDGMPGDLQFTETGVEPRASNRRGMKVTLGIMPDFTGSGTDGLGVDFVNPDGAAASGGMQKGDKIVALNGFEVKNIYDYMARMKKFKKGQTITVDVMRNGEKVVLIVQL